MEFSLTRCSCVAATATFLCNGTADDRKAKEEGAIKHDTTVLKLDVKTH